MRKQHILQQEFLDSTNNNNFILYRNFDRYGMNIKILIKDSTIADDDVKNFHPDEIDCSTQVYGVFISSTDSQNQALLDKLGGILKMNTHLHNSHNWRVTADEGNYKLDILEIEEKGNKIIQSFSLEEDIVYSIFSISDLLKIFAEGPNLTAKQQFYVMTKYAELSEKEKKNVKIFSREEIQQNMKARAEEKKRKEYEATPEYKEKLEKEKLEKEQEQLKIEALKKQENQIEKAIREAFPYLEHTPSTFKALKFDTVNYTVCKVEMDDKEIGVIMNERREEFSVKLVKLEKSKNYSIMIGFCDKNYLDSYSIENMEKADYKKNLEKRPKLVAFCNNGKVKADAKFNWKDALDETKKFDYILKEGDTIKVREDRERGLILWYVSNQNFQEKMVANYKKSLADGTDWRPYVELEKIGDTIMWCEN